MAYRVSVFGGWSSQLFISRLLVVTNRAVGMFSVRGLNITDVFKASRMRESLPLTPLWDPALEAYMVIDEMQTSSSTSSQWYVLLIKSRQNKPPHLSR